MVTTEKIVKAIKDLLTKSDKTASTSGRDQTTIITREELTASTPSALSKEKRTFSTTSAILQLLNDVPPSQIFGVKLAPFLSQKDIAAKYSVHEQPWHPHDWRKKAIVNTLRAAACISVMDQLKSYQVNKALPENLTIPQEKTVLFFCERASEVITATTSISERLKVDFTDSSTFERILKILEPYFEVDTHQVRDEILLKVGKESQGVSASFLPVYLQLIYTVFQRDKEKYPELANLNDDVSNYQQLCIHSQAIFLNGAGSTAGKLAAYFEIILHFVGLGFSIAQIEHFSLVKSPKKANDLSHFVIHLKSSSSRAINHIYKIKYHIHEGNLLVTECPAMARSRDLHTGDAIEEHPTSSTIETEHDHNLLQAILHKTLFD